MSTAARRPGPHTLAEWLAQPEERRLELIDGEFVEKAAPTFQLGVAQASACEPFDAIELQVAVLFGDDPDD